MRRGEQQIVDGAAAIQQVTDMARGSEPQQYVDIGQTHVRIEQDHLVPGHRQ